MKESQKFKEANISSHYYVVHEQCVQLRKKLNALMDAPATPPVAGCQVVDPLSALKLWERCLRTSTKKLSSCIRVFSRTILGQSGKMSYARIQRTLVPVEQEINQLLALQNQLRQHPLTGKWHEGRLLLCSCIKKMSVDIEKKISFLINTLQACNDKEKKINQRCFCAAEISCKKEMAEYKKWRKSMRGPLILLSKKRRLPIIMPGFPTKMQPGNSFLCRA